MTPAIELQNVSKIYRRYGGRQFSTLKSALLQRSILRDLQPRETFQALDDVSFVVPAGATHNIINTGSVPLKLYTLYAPPNHRDGVVHHTCHDAEADSEHFDGKTTE